MGEGRWKKQEAAREGEKEEAIKDRRGDTKRTWRKGEEEEKDGGQIGRGRERQSPRRRRSQNTTLLLLKSRSWANPKRFPNAPRGRKKTAAADRRGEKLPPVEG